MLINLRNAMMTGKQLPYRRRVEYIDTNSGGCSMSDIVIGPDFGYGIIARLAVVIGSGDQMIGNCRTKSDHDQTACRFFCAGSGVYSDISKARIATGSSAYTTGVFSDWNIYTGTDKKGSYIKKDGVDIISTYGLRNRNPGQFPLNICTYSELNTIHGRMKLSTVTLLQSGNVIVDLFAVETLDGKAGLYNTVNGKVYTATVGNEFLLPT